MREFHHFNIDLWQQKRKIEAEIEERQKELERINVQLGLHNPRQPKTRYSFDRNGLLTSEPNSSSQYIPKPTPDWSDYKHLYPTRDIKPPTKDTTKSTEDLPEYKNLQHTDKPGDGFPSIFLWLFVLLIGIYILSYQGSIEKQKPNKQGYPRDVPAQLGARDSR